MNLWATPEFKLWLDDAKPRECPFCTARSKPSTRGKARRICSAPGCAKIYQCIYKRTRRAKSLGLG